ncbi:hypothetical protein H4W23_31725 [Streptomyces gardneri]|uniref:hypothetical protein n=1 Tax=Streptomyces gardneri TaxID=66892 RepID=UPI0012664E1E|nr:hypothetical protein [Streptomyces gardneri]QPK48763.1 hypothetical protein H4W23_31725 [Streptomyces gardneri]WRK40243.1 hypothetical protein U0M97_31880 [Streptomyces venezuelae]
MHHTENRGHMGDTAKVDQDAVLRARVLLLGSGRLTARERVGAYRVLAEVSPSAYLPKLVDALIERSYELDEPELHVTLYAEALAAARRLHADAPRREGRLSRALSGYEHALFAAGRRAEGRALCEESAEAGRYGRLAVVLAEEGCHAEAAELLGGHAGTGDADPASDWTLIEWAAELDAAGRQEEALEVFARLVDGGRRGASADSAPLASLVWKLDRYARMLGAAGRREGEVAARHEALGLLTRLARGGEPVSRSNIQALWATLLGLSGRPDEPAATSGAPLPAFGAHVFHGWSPDTREDYFASVALLERRTAALRASGDLPGLIVTQRRLTVRRALRWESSGRRPEDALRPSFDEGVALARLSPVDPGVLARALADRSMFLVAVKRYGEALADFTEATALLDGLTPPPIVTRT